MDAKAQQGLTGESVLILNLASEPIDIMWKNMGGTRGVFIFRRLILYFLGLVIIIFISTPTAILSTIQYVDVFGLFDFTWFDNLPYG